MLKTHDTARKILASLYSKIYSDNSQILYTDEESEPITITRPYYIAEDNYNVNTEENIIQITYKELKRMGKGIYSISNFNGRNRVTYRIFPVSHAPLEAYEKKEIPPQHTVQYNKMTKKCRLVGRLGHEKWV